MPQCRSAETRRRLAPGTSGAERRERMRQAGEGSTVLNPGVEVQRLALLVDSDPDARHLHAGFLRASHYLVEETADGRVALAKALARPPDIILAETRLPGISGIDLCRILRDDSLTRDIPLVFVTGDDDDMVLRRAEAGGAATVLVKPCVAERLTLAVQQF